MQRGKKSVVMSTAPTPTCDLHYDAWRGVEHHLTDALIGLYPHVVDIIMQRLRGHYATYESAVHGFGSQAELHRIRKSFQASHPSLVVAKYGTTMARRGAISRPPDRLRQLASWVFPFPGSDASVVRRTVRSLYGGRTPGEWKLRR